MCACVCMRMRVSLRVCVCVCVCECMCAYACMCMRMRLYVCACACVCVCAFMTMLRMVPSCARWNTWVGQHFLRLDLQHPIIRHSCGQCQLLGHCCFNSTSGGYRTGASCETNVVVATAAMVTLSCARVVMYAIERFHARTIGDTPTHTKTLGTHNMKSFGTCVS